MLSVPFLAPPPLPGIRWVGWSKLKLNTGETKSVNPRGKRESCASCFPCVCLSVSSFSVTRWRGAPVSVPRGRPLVIVSAPAAAVSASVVIIPSWWPVVVPVAATAAAAVATAAATAIATAAAAAAVATAAAAAAEATASSTASSSPVSAPRPSWDSGGDRNAPAPHLLVVEVGDRILPSALRLEADETESPEAKRRGEKKTRRVGSTREHERRKTGR